MRFAVTASAAVDLTPGGEAAAVAFFEHIDYALIIGLVERYKYSFHIIVLSGLICLAELTACAADSHIGEEAVHGGHEQQREDG